jgi:hypothetical protein
LQEGQILSGWAAEEHAAIHFVDEQPLGAICDRADAKAYRVSWDGERVVEESLAMRDVSVVK